MDTPEREPAVPREELEVAIHARQELSPEHEPEIVEAFLERVGNAIDARVDERIAEQESGDDVGFDTGAIGVAIGSIALGIPITAVAASNGGGVPGVVVAWIGIVLVNIAYGRSSR